MARVQSLVWELRSGKLLSAAKKKKAVKVLQCAFDGNSVYLPADWTGQVPALPHCQRPPPLCLGGSASLSDSLLHLGLFTFQLTWQWYSLF